MTECNFYETMSSVIRYHRKCSGLSQQSLAQLAGIGKTVVYDVEHAKASVHLDTLIKICQALNIHLEFCSPLMASYQQSLKDKST